jgi:hypothetical protein
MKRILNDISIPIGIKSGSRITVFDLKDDEFGSRCNCTCPDCGFPLLAIPGSKYRSAHFKHKAGNIHCHFNFDETVREYIYDKLLGLKQFTASLEDLEYINVISKHHPKVENTPQLTQPRQITVLEKKEGKIRIRIDDVDFWIKLVFKRKEAVNDNQIIAITLPELIRVNNLSDKELDYIRALINLKCNEKLMIRSNQVQIEKAQAKPIIQPREEYKAQSVPFNMIGAMKDSSSSETPAYPCPLCKTGELEIKFTSRTNEPMFSCKNPSCDFWDTKINDYANGKIILAKEVHYNMTHPKK